MIVGVGVRKRAGKDSYFEAVRDNFKFFNVRNFAFGDALKEDVWHMYCPILEKYDITRETFFSDEFKTTMRPLLQSHGVFMREMDPDYWVDILVNNVKKWESQNLRNIAIITDVRFPNEARAVRNMGGFLIKVNRDLSDNSGDEHISEHALDNWDDWDHILDNNGTLSEYRDKVKLNFMQLLDKV
jgi:hypothetical protein